MLEGNLASFLSLEFHIFLYLPIHPSWANYRRRIDIYVKKMPIREGSCMLCGWPTEDLQMPLLLPTLVLVPLLGKALAIAIDRDLWQMWVWSCSPLACFIDHTQISADFFRNQQWWCKLSICQLFCTVKHCWSVLEDARWRLSQASDVFLCTSILSACLALPFFRTAEIKLTQRFARHLLRYLTFLLLLLSETCGLTPFHTLETSLLLNQLDQRTTLQ